MSEPKQESGRPRRPRTSIALAAPPERALGRAQRAGARFRFLAEASRLLADSLDYQATLSTVAKLALPNLGAWCVVDLVTPDGAVQRLAVVHPDPRKQQLALRLEAGWPPHRDDPIGAPAVIRTRRAEVIRRVDGRMLGELARDPGNLVILRELGIGSVIVVPMLARDRVLGAMTFIGPAKGPGYTDEDVELAEDLAARCGLAIENARLYGEAQAARREAEMASRAKSEFLAISSHEIRTPINAIVGYAQLLEMGLDGPVTDQQRARLERIHTSSQHLLGLVNEILDLAKVESGQMTVRREAGNFADAVERAYEMVYPQTVRCDLTLDQQCAVPDGARYAGDPERVLQIVLNLLANACKFSPSGGRLVVRCGTAHEAAPEARLNGSGPWAYVLVADQGRGIEPDMLEQIFEPFVQADASHTRREGGSGLGLTISRQLARLMGGDLTVHSTVGEGSCFTLWLPAAPDAAQPPQERRSFDREVSQLAALGAMLRARSAAVTRRYVAALREEAVVPLPSRFNEVELLNNTPSLLSSLAQTLELAHARGGGASLVLRDGSRIQQVICELHGAQRRRLGWSEEALRRDFQHLRRAVLDELSGALRDEGEADRTLPVLERIFDQAQRVGLQAWHQLPPR